MARRGSLGGLAKAVGIFLLGSLGTPQPSASEPIRVETRTTWTTAAQPEIHLLLQADHTTTGTVAVFLPEHVVCDGKEAPSASEKLRIFDTLSRLPFSLTTGELRPDAWLHRSYPVGGYRVLSGQCIATYRVADWTSGKTLVSGEIPISAIPPAFDETSASGGSLDVSMETERDSRFGELHLVKLLVRNREDHAVLISESDRRLSCSSGSSADWAFRPNVIQGEDSGPVWVPAKSWAVLQNAVALRAGSIVGCKVEVELSAYRVGEGLVPVKRFQAEIRQSGHLRRITHGGTE